MKRSSSLTRKALAATAIALGVGAAGALPALAGGQSGTASGECNNGGNGYTTERTILTSPAYVATEYAVIDGDGSQLVMVCYSDTPYGAPSSLAGGFVNVREDGHDFDAVWCQSDPGTTVAANCMIAATASVNDPNPTTPGGTVSGAAAVNGVFVNGAQTGAEVGSPTTALDAPFNGNQWAGAAAGIGNGTCVYANGAPVYCPGSSPFSAEESFNENDGPGVGLTGGTGAAVWVGNSNSNTVDGTFDANVDYRCVNVGSPAPPCPTTRTP